MILRRGKLVKVRLNSGELVNATYIQMFHPGEHMVKYKDCYYCATDKFYDDSCVRFVGNPCVLLTSEVK